MLSIGALDELERVFRELRNANGDLAGDEEDLYICDGEPLHAPINVGEVRRLIIMAQRYKRISRPFTTP